MPVQIVSDAGDETYQVVVRDGESSAVAVCATPCRLRLARGSYSAEAHSGDRTFVVRFDLRAGASMRVRLGQHDSLRQWTGLALAAVGLSAGAVAVDHWRYLALEGAGLATRPWVSQYLPTVHGDLAFATGVAFVPLAAVLLIPAFRLLSQPLRSAVAERMPAMRTYRNRWSAIRLRSMRFDFVQGGGMLGASVSF